MATTKKAAPKKRPVDVQRCESRGPKPERFRCGLIAGHRGAHSALTPSGYPWAQKATV